MLATSAIPSLADPVQGKESVESLSAEGDSVSDQADGRDNSEAEGAYDADSTESTDLKDDESDIADPDSLPSEPLNKDTDDIDELEPVTNFVPNHPFTATSMLGQNINNRVQVVLIYAIHTAADKSLGLDVSGGRAYIRTNVLIYDDRGAEHQKWYALRNSDGTISFVSYGTGRALDVEGNNWANQTNVQIHTPRFEDSQKWNIIDAGNGSCYIQHAESGKVLTMSGSSPSRGANLYIDQAVNSKMQQFTLDLVSDEPYKGDVLLCSDQDVKQVVTSSSSGNISLKTRTNGNDQIYTISASDRGGYYYLTNKNSGKRLSVSGDAREGVRVVESTPTGSSTQLWHVMKKSNGTYVFLTAQANHLCLAFEDGMAVLASYHYLDGQKFYLKNPDQTLYGGVHIIKSVKYPDRVFDVASGSVANDANIQSYNNNWTEAQQFKFERVPGVSGEVYYIFCVKSGLALGYQGSCVAGATVKQYNVTRDDSQKWVIKSDGDGSVSIHPYRNQNLAIDISGANVAIRSDILLYTYRGADNQKWYLGSRRINTCKLKGSNVVTVSGTKYDENSIGDDGMLYIFAKDNLAYRTTGQSPIGFSADGSNFTVNSSTLNAQSFINMEFFVGIKKDGQYYIESNGMYITNPEAAASKTFARTNPMNKKGLAIYWDTDKVNEAINTLHIKNATFNIPLAQLVAGGSYQYNYKGRTYGFNAGIPGFYKQRVAALNAAGVQVTVVVYADISTPSNLVTPTGRSFNPNEQLLVGMNAQEMGGRDRLEACFAFLADTFSDPSAHVDNFVIGNELDDPVSWNYCGEQVPIDKYVYWYTQVYRLAYNTMKSIWSNVEVYDSLDHVWNTTSRGARYYTARDFQDTFATQLKEEGDISWGLAFHPYCSPEQDPRFWNSPNYGLTQNATNTPTVTMWNLGSFATYCQNTYGKNHRIILSETGLSARYNGVDMEAQQAAACAYAYYITEMTNGVDNLTIHCYKDTPEEMAGGWYLGIRRSDGSARPSYNVLTYMDSKANGMRVTTPYVSQINGASSWTQLLPGLDINKFGDSRY
ncbi:MAG: RICIN domain-containing protein, partial [Lachnospiraceae bacterium]|nr:RICIN domain-containing protein [Candidatus Equihabitans merdae]